MRVLVTGGTGYLGRAIVKASLAATQNESWPLGAGASVAPACAAVITKKRRNGEVMR